MTNLIHSFRVMIRDKFHTLINIIGLSFGLTCSTIILVYVHNEFSYDRYHEHADRIYRVAQNFVTSERPEKFAITSPALGPALYNEFPQVEAFVRVKSSNRILVVHENREFYENNFAFADTNFFKVFTYEFLLGDAATCLQNPEDIVISESLAKKYFGETYPINKVLLLENRLPLTVSAIIKDPPSNSHIPENAFISYLAAEKLMHLRSEDWSMFEITDFTYLLFYRDFDREAFDANWPEFYREYLAEDGEKYGQVYEPVFQKLQEIHYHSDLPEDYATGNRSFLYTLILIGVIILILAGINYTNMSTARALIRIREAGIRKVMGAGRRSLIAKFFIESLLISFFTLILALASVEFILEFTSFNTLIGSNLELRLSQKPSLLVLILSVTILFSLLASVHPAILLSRYPPSDAIRSQFNLGPKGMVMRHVLVVFQLFLGTVAIIFTLLSRTQLKYMENRDLGFDSENVMILPVRDSAMEASIPFILKELEDIPGIQSTTTCWHYPGFPSSGLYTFEGKDGMEEHNIPALYVNFGFLETMGLELAEGRDFDRQYGSDSSGAVLINETLARFMGWEDPIGKKINHFDNFEAQVAGVVKDFHFKSLHYTIEPLIFRLVWSYRGYLALRASGKYTAGILDYIEEKYSEIVPQRPFEYFFLDDQFKQKYEVDRMQIKLITWFASVCMIIAALGILGLVSYSVERRTREIGLRKVNGAHSTGIILQLSKVFLFLNLYSFVAAIPVTILVFRVWLRAFSYQVDIHAGIILLSLLIVLVITLLTVFFRTRNAARMNPAASIRYE